MTTAVYIRVSTDKQDPARQRAEISDYLGDDFVTVREYADIASGAKDNREDFQRLWSDIEAGEIDRVVSWEMSRLSRRLSTAAQFLELCAEQGVALETLNDMFPDLRGGGKDDVWDRLLAKFAAWMMEFEREMTRERIKSGVEQARQQGKWVGQAPFGFEIDDDGYLEVQPDPFIRMQLAMRDALTMPDVAVSRIADRHRVPDTSLRRYLDDEDRRELYLFGDADDERIEDALADSRVGDDADDRLDKLEGMIEDAKADSGE